MALEIEYVPERHPGRWVLLVVIILLVIVSGWFAFRWYWYGDSLPLPLPVASADSGLDKSDVTAIQTAQYTVSGSSPRFISIPSLSVSDVRIYPVELDGDNLLKFASNVHDAAWYKKSGTPGNGGVILIDGYNQIDNVAGAFAKLGTLQKDDKIILQRGDGKLFTYKVVENQSMSLDEVNATGMTTMGKAVKPGLEGLNLITFDGKWIPRLGTFDKRIMLRAVIDLTK
jgi:hypothetical protein